MSGKIRLVGLRDWGSKISNSSHYHHHSPLILIMMVKTNTMTLLTGEKEFR